ncbi:MAG: DUF4138 domain-containing protein [Rickettsiaceae bacterium]|nr:MAG: DUF4138 domain-containing protein [Rickettsiaceae bacterium]
MGKSILLTFVAFILLTKSSYAQTIKAQKATDYPVNTNQILKKDLKVIYISSDVNLHFRTPEPVQFVDLSTTRLIGDLPTENVVRIKIQKTEGKTETVIRVSNPKSNAKNTNVNDTLKRTIETPLTYTDQEELGIVTIVGQSFMAQYKIVYRVPEYSSIVVTNIEILPSEMQPLEYPKYELSNTELKRFAMTVMKEKPNSTIRTNKHLMLVSSLNSIYTMGDYIFLDISFKNQSNLAYDIDVLKFSIDDKKVFKSTNNQSIDIEPIYTLYDHKRFNKSYRNVYVFKKFTYPNNKVLNIRLIEDEVSGRTINLEVKYQDILQADTF